MRSLKVLLVALATLSPSALATRSLSEIKSFSDGCRPRDPQFYSADKVGFYCFTENVANFDYTYSTINLGKCIGNNAGTLVGFNNGNYTSTCKNCTVITIREGDHSTCLLQCECPDMNGHKKTSKIDLNDVLRNDNGRLVCFGHRGTRDRVPPECFHNEECATGAPRLAPRAEPTRVA